MGKLDGKVAFITGAARGQGRSHAVRLAQEGADIIAVDLCRQIDTVPYPMAEPADLDLTVKEIESLDRRIVASQADVRDLSAMTQAVQDGVAQLGRLDIVLGNAGIASVGDETDPSASWNDVIAVNLTGVWNTLHATAPQLIEQGDGGAIVLTSSTQGLTGRGGNGSGGFSAYTAAKHGVVGLMRSYATWLAPHNIRVNSVHPTGVETPMVMNEAIGKWIAENPEAASVLANMMPVDLIQAVDISNAILFLVSDDGRYVTGVTLPVDAGFTAK